MSDSRKNIKKVRSSTWRELVRFTRPQHGLAILVLLFAAANAATNGFLIYQVKVFIDHILPNALADETKELSEVLRIVLGFIVTMTLLLLANGIFKGLELFTNAKFGQTLLRRFRDEIFRHHQALSLDYYEHEKTGKIMSYTTTDVIRLREYLALQWPKMIRGGLAVIIYFIFMMVISWKITLISFIVFPLLYGLTQLGAKAIRKISTKVLEKLSDISAVLQEAIANILVVKSFVAEKHEVARFNLENRETYKAEMKLAGVKAILIPPMQFLIAIAVGIFLYLGTRAVRITGELTAGGLITVVLFLQQLTTEALNAARGYFGLQEALAAADRIFGFLRLEPSIKDPENPEQMTEQRGEVRFDSVRFKYDEGDEVLTEINLTAQPGKTIAIVGPSGAGKTSLVKLIPRLYDVSGGTVYVDGHDVRKLKLDELRSIMGIVPQETILFSFSVRDNIAYGKPDATEEEVIAAAKAANAHEFIKQLPEGYNSIVGERGAKLSGGQAQRVAIARAILKDPKILILDEATSNLDTESEKLVQSALERLMKGRTAFVIAHRLSTIRDADEIIVMENGRIAGRGRHDELMQSNDIYRRLYEMQLSSSDEVH